MNYTDRLLSESLGITGGKHVNDTTPAPGTWFAFQVIADATITELQEGGAVVPQMAGAVLTSGFVYYGNITSVTLTSGHIKLFGHTDPYTAGPATSGGRS